MAYCCCCSLSFFNNFVYIANSAKFKSTPNKSVIAASKWTVTTYTVNGDILGGILGLVTETSYITESRK